MSSKSAVFSPLPMMKNMLSLLSMMRQTRHDQRMRLHASFLLIERPHEYFDMQSNITPKGNHTNASKGSVTFQECCADENLTGAPALGKGGAFICRKASYNALGVCTPAHPESQTSFPYRSEKCVRKQRSEKCNENEVTDCSKIGSDAIADRKFSTHQTQPDLITAHSL